MQAIATPGWYGTQPAFSHSTAMIPEPIKQLRPSRISGKLGERSRERERVRRGDSRRLRADRFLLETAPPVVLLLQAPPLFPGSQSGPAARERGPRVRIILAGKDEEGNIGDCVRSVLSAEYTNFELIVVDDRSSDGTAVEVAQAAGWRPAASGCFGSASRRPAGQAR